MYKPEDLNIKNVIPQMHNTDEPSFSNWLEQSAVELTAIRKIMMSYINTVLDEEQKKKFLEYFQK